MSSKASLSSTSNSSFSNSSSSRSSSCESESDTTTRCSSVESTAAVENEERIQYLAEEGNGEVHIKIVIVGSNESLKSSLQTRLAYAASNSFSFGAQSSSYETSFGRHFRVRHLTVDGGVRVRVEIWRDGPPPKPSDQTYQTLLGAAPPPAWADAHAVLYVHDDNKPTNDDRQQQNRLANSNSSIDKIEASAAEYQLASVQRDRPYLPKSCIMNTTSSNDNNSDIDDLNVLTNVLRMDQFHVSLQNGSGIERMLRSVVRRALQYKRTYPQLIGEYLKEVNQMEQAALAWKSARAVKLLAQSKSCWQPSSTYSRKSRSPLLFAPRQECKMQ